jgi:hypothetical protein
MEASNTRGTDHTISARKLSKNRTEELKTQPTRTDKRGQRAASYKDYQSIKRNPKSQVSNQATLLFMFIIFHGLLKRWQSSHSNAIRVNAARPTDTSSRHTYTVYSSPPYPQCTKRRYRWCEIICNAIQKTHRQEKKEYTSVTPWYQLRSCARNFSFAHSRR